MVGILLAGRDCGPGAHAFAEDVARFLARDGDPAHLFFLIPHPMDAPRVIHSIVRSDKPAARLEPTLSVDETTPLPFEHREFDAVCRLLTEQMMAQMARHRITTLHAIGLDLPSSVAERLHKKLQVPFFVTPRGSDLSRTEVLYQTRARVALLNANQVIAFDEETRLKLRTQFDLPTSPPKTQVLRRGIDLNSWRPLRRHERAAVAADRLTRPEVAAPLDGVAWDHNFVLLAVEPRGDRHGFEQFLFATPEILRQHADMQIVVVGNGEARRLTDGLRAAMSAGRAELLYDIVKTSELCQPLVDHLERLHQEGRADVWWKSASRIEPERRVRFLGPLTRNEFSTLLPMADLLVVPGSKVRPPSQMFYESLACGVLPMASELAGITPLADRVGERISREIAALCVLRSGVQPVREMEEKLGRVARLRPDLRQRLRSLAEEEFDGHQVAVNLRRIYSRRSQPTAVTA